MSFEELDSLINESLKETNKVKDSSEKPIIMVIDDDKNVLEDIGFVFKHKYEMILCSTGKEGLEKLRDDISTIILDIKMPGQDGFQVFQKIKEKSPHLPIIFHSAYQDLKDPYQIMNEYRPFGYVSKGGGLQPLQDSVFSAIDYYDQIQHNKVLVQELEQLNKNLERKVEERTAELQKVMKELEESNEKLKHISNFDALTNVYNRRGFEDLYKKEFDRAFREKETLTVILIDIDHFKKFNDTYGHQKGDDCLAKVAGAINGTLSRSTDFCARYGGEEFIVVLPNTEIPGAKQIAETLRKNVQDLNISHESSTTEDVVTISVGLSAVCPHPKLKPEKIINQADEALYDAKESGRNCFKVFEEKK